MTNQLEYDLILNSNSIVKASSVKTYMHNGWIPKAEITTYKNNETQDTERAASEVSKNKKSTFRQKSWIPWPKL